MLGVGVIFMLLGGVIIQLGQQPADTSAPIPEKLTPAEVGFIGGGPLLAIAAALTGLVAQGRLKCVERKLVMGQPLDRDATPLEQALVSLIERPSGPLPQVCAKPLAEIQRSLRQAGLLHPSYPSGLRLLGLLLILVPVVIDVARFAPAHADHTGLCFLILVQILLLLAIYSKMPATSPGGNHLLEQLREARADLRLAPEKFPGPKSSRITAEELALSVALFGAMTLSGTQFFPVLELAYPGTGVPPQDFQVTAFNRGFVVTERPPTSADGHGRDSHSYESGDSSYDSGDSSY